MKKKKKEIMVVWDMGITVRCTKAGGFRLYVANWWVWEVRKRREPVRNSSF